MIVADSSLIYALLDSRDQRHTEAASWYESNEDDLATTLLVIAEVDHLARRVGPKATRAFREDLVAGAYHLDRAPDLGTLVLIAETYRELGVSLTDASLVQLASRYETTRIGTFDQRHFRAMTPLGEEGGHFTLLPADA